LIKSYTAFIPLPDTISWFFWWPVNRDSKAYGRYRAIIFRWFTTLVK